jgi:hypothetical protein
MGIERPLYFAQETDIIVFEMPGQILNRCLVDEGEARDECGLVFVLHVTGLQMLIQSLEGERMRKIGLIGEAGVRHLRHVLDEGLLLRP